LLTTKQQHNKQDLNITNEPETYVLRENQIQDQISSTRNFSRSSRESFPEAQASESSLLREKYLDQAAASAQKTSSYYSKFQSLASPSGKAAVGSEKREP